MADKRITDVDFVSSLDSNESFFINQNNAIKQINRSDVVFGVTNGGTGATTKEEALENLEAFPLAGNKTITGWVEVMGDIRASGNLNTTGTLGVLGDGGKGVNIQGRYLNEIVPELHLGGSSGNELVLVKGIFTPIDDQDAVNKGYVDNNYIPKIIKTNYKDIVSFTVENNHDYICTSTTSLTMIGSPVEAHGFITFSNTFDPLTNPINVSGFTAFAGDDINEALASEVWEFSVYPHNGASFIIWKNWSAD